jgi:hypothetical protein
MRKLISILVVFTLFGCEKYELETYAPLILNGGQWMLSDYEIKIISCQGCNDARDLDKIEVVKTDSVGLQSFKFKQVTDSTITLTQDFTKTPLSRLFILDRNGIKSTKWEFETYELSTFFNGNRGIKNCWVSYNSDTRMTINDMKQIGDRPVVSTSWTYYTEKKQGVRPRELLILLSPAVTTDVLIGNRATDKLITYKLQLVFMRN